MAEINPQAGPVRRGKGAHARRLKNIRMDLTPLVDLGFLLITFFVFTSVLSKPRAMQLFLPAGQIAGTDYANSTVLTIIPYDGEKLFFYHGSLPDALAGGRWGFSSFSLATGIGRIIRMKMDALDHSGRFTRRDFALIIKPAENASYKSIAQSLDEVLIDAVPHYSFAELDENEKGRLRSLHLIPSGQPQKP
jgi:hypothetical protein